MGQRKESLLRAIEHLASIHHDWLLESEARTVTIELQEAVDNCLAEFTEGDIPQDCQKLFVAADKLAALWNVWTEEAVELKDPSLLPSRDVWDAMEALYDARKVSEQRKRPHIETLKQLDKEKLTPSQICRTYEWYLPNGAEDLAKLQEERDRPGTHLGKHFVHPLERRRQKDEAKRQQARAEFRELQQAKLQQIEQVAPESLVDLVNENLSAKQIAGMKKISTDALFRECDRLGIARPPLDYSDPRVTRGKAEPDVPDSVKRAMDAELTRPTRGTQRSAEDKKTEPTKEAKKTEEAHDMAAEPVEDQVEAMAKNGKSPKEIAASLKASGTSITHTRVSAMLRHFCQPPAA